MFATVAAPASSHAPHCPIASRFAPLRHLVGDTPLLAIRFRLRGRERTIFAKAEHLNLTGSLKDRMALHLLETAYRDGSLQPGDRLVEATSGNTGIALAAIGRALGHPTTIYMPDWLSQERVKLIQSFGADIVLVSKEEGGFLGSIRRTQELAASTPGIFLPRQFANRANLEAHRCTTGPEILEQMASVGEVPAAFVAGVGTGGTIMGVGRFLRGNVPGVRIHPVEPAESPTLSTGHKVGSHRIQGISDEFIPSILHLEELDEVLAISDSDSILMAQKLARTLGLGVGISSGCNFLAAVRAQEALGPEVPVVTLFCDDNKKYLSTALFGDEPVRDDHMTPHIELLDYRVIRRPSGAAAQA